MKRATMRAFKCRAGVHRPQLVGVGTATCKDCGAHLWASSVTGRIRAHRLEMHRERVLRRHDVPVYVVMHVDAESIERRMLETLATKGVKR